MDMVAAVAAAVEVGADITVEVVAAEAGIIMAVAAPVVGITTEAEISPRGMPRSWDITRITARIPRHRRHSPKPAGTMVDMPASTARGPCTPARIRLVDFRMD